MVNNLYIVTPRGFCAGVEMAIKALTWMLKIYDEPIYCYHEIVHNDWIVNKFKDKNIKFIESTDELPKDAVLMLSAHGTSPNVESQFNSISSVQVNAVCPLVTKVIVSSLAPGVVSALTYVNPSTDLTPPNPFQLLPS